MTTTTTTQPKVGQYYSTSWGYDQTNYDFIIVVGISPTGKTAICRCVLPIHLGEAAQTDILTPGGDAIGPNFRLKITPNGRLRGSYPYIIGHWDSTRLGSFTPAKFGKSYYQTMEIFGH